MNSFVTKKQVGCQGAMLLASFGGISMEPHLPGLPSKGETPVAKQVDGRAQLGLQTLTLVHNFQPASPCSSQLDIAHNAASLLQCCCLLLLLLHAKRRTPFTYLKICEIPANLSER